MSNSTCDLQRKENTEQQHVPRPGEGASATEGASSPSFQFQATPNPLPNVDVAGARGGVQRGAPLSWLALQEQPVNQAVTLNGVFIGPPVRRVSSAGGVAEYSGLYQSMWCSAV